MKKIWKNKKYKSDFIGEYQWTKLYTGSSERVFILVSGAKQISFDSFWAAKRAGWFTV